MKTTPWIPLRHAHPETVILLAIMTLSTCLPVAAATVTAPYENTFSESTTDFTFAPEARWFHIPAEGVYSNDFEGTIGTAGISISNLGGNAASAKPFTVTAQLVVLVGAGTYSYTGLGFLGDDETLPMTQGYSFYHIMSKSELVINRNGTVVTNIPTFMGSGIRWNHNPIRLTVQGVYVDTNADGMNDALDILRAACRRRR